MSEKETSNGEIVEAIQDLTRIFLATHGEFASKSEIIRKLTELSIPPSRIARLLGMQLKDVTSAIYKKNKKSKQKSKDLDEMPSADVAKFDNHD